MISTILELSQQVFRHDRYTVLNLFTSRPVKLCERQFLWVNGQGAIKISENKLADRLQVVRTPI
ncbi:hypothetical protein [Phormidesmis priestleyi]|uniref:hypothetical protein n=1 Tax=Phormidesmis priestleyi TaxID=268141 RepID=UPI0018D393E6|nr:hypothetical protein [Phormidesmis priestleyi]